MDDDGGILESLDKDYMPRAGGINLQKSPDINAYHASPPVSPHNPTSRFEEFVSSPRQGTPDLEEESSHAPSQTTPTTTVAHISSSETNLTGLFHIISVLFAIVSLLTLIPLFELFPLIFGIIIRYDLRCSIKNAVALHILNLVVTTSVFIFFCVVIVIIAVFTYGIGLVLLLFLLPMLGVLAILVSYYPRTLPNEELL
mmetsp:Transcript_20617/g.26074  ORF Transcript_20617/g.26074 Transcript_20617/m.26074 type:complete len:199 (-) Transcript_20617:64-660(-)